MAFVSKEDFDSVINTIFEKRQDKEKPLWTRQRIEEAIKMIEEFKAAGTLGKSRTSKQYYYGNKYDVMDDGMRKCLILKQKSDVDPVVEIPSSEEFHRILCEFHQSTGHGGRDKLLHSLKSKYFIPFLVIGEFLKLCRVCRSKRNFPKMGILVRPIISSDGQFSPERPSESPEGNYVATFEPVSSIKSENENSSSSIPTLTCATLEPSSRPAKRKEPEDTALTPDVLLSVNEGFSRPQMLEDRFDIFGKNVAVKLRDLPKQQRIICEKLINDALYAAEMGSLTIDHTLSKAAISMFNNSQS